MRVGRKIHIDKINIFLKAKEISFKGACKSRDLSEHLVTESGHTRPLGSTTALNWTPARTRARKEKQPKTDIFSNFPFQGINRFQEKKDINISCEPRRRVWGGRTSEEKVSTTERSGRVGLLMLSTSTLFPFILSAECEMPVTDGEPFRFSHVSSPSRPPDIRLIFEDRRQGTHA